MISKVKILGDNHIRFPRWLDALIYDEIKACYQPCRQDMVVLNWDRTEIIKYLGTYFPRSFAESYCIFSRYFKEHKNDFAQEESLNIFDFGCGTGGELLGLLWAIKENLSVSTITIKALDGNFNALRFLEHIIERFKMDFHDGLSLKVMALQIDDFYDMSVVESQIPYDNHIVLIFKSICEMASLRQFDEKNPYEHILNIMLGKLSSNGIICLADVSSFNEEQKEWLPKLIDKACLATGSNVCMRNENYNEVFHVSHSAKPKDTSKLSWRIIKN
ncbi:MAG: hypothetical protein K2M56_07750 [Muribaculaceae bacterium]|nr:hypothetical protein [Muribaculaceae bacterium]